jgi:hypothetical protein
MAERWDILSPADLLAAVEGSGRKNRKTTFPNGYIYHAFVGTSR